MDLFQAVVLGLVQGLGEFLPISSSAHLVLTPWVFGWQDPGLTFDVALHFGTLIAVVWYFRQEWIRLAVSLFVPKNQDPTYNRNFLGLLVVATIPGVLAGFFLEDYAENVFRSPLIVASMLVVVGFLLYWFDKRLVVQKNLEKIGYLDAVIIGIAQAAAIVPGVSRSGSTITAGLASGVDRTSAAKFSFLMLTPITFGAVILKAGDFLSSPVGLPEIIGIVVSAISGYLAIAGLLKLVQKASYKFFFWYRLVLALLILGLYFSRN